MVVNLKPHQQEVLSKLSNRKVLLGGVGSGKTVTSLAYYWIYELGGVLNQPETIQTPKDLYILTTANKRDKNDWQGWAAQMWLSEDPEISAHGIRVTVDSYNNIKKYAEVKNAFFIFDEQRLVGSGAWAKAFLRIAQHNNWILLSATPGDVWEDYIPLFIANGWYKNRTQFKREHIVYSPYSKFPKVLRYLEEGKLLRLRNELLVDMPFERHTTRHIHRTFVDHDQELFERVVKQRWHVYENRPIREVSELFSVMRKVVNSSPSRLEAVRDLWTRHPRMVVFYNFDYELEMLRTLAQTPEMSLRTSLSSSPTETQIQSFESTPIPTQSGLSIPDGPQLTPQSLSSTPGDSSASRKPQHATTEPSVPGSFGVSPIGAGSKPASTLSPTTSPTSRRTSSGSSSQIQKENDKWITTDTSSGRSITRGGFGNKMRSQSSESSTVGPTPVRSDTFEGSVSSNQSVQIAEWNGHKHQPVPTSDRWIYLVQYVAGAEAWDCVTTDTIVFYSMTYSYRNFEQAQGRIDRLNTPYTDLHYYLLSSRSPIDIAIARALRNKRDFNEKDY